MNKYILIIVIGLLVSFSSCNDTKKPTTKSKTSVPPKKEVVKQLPQITPPNFNADTAYYYIEQQVNFGPRVPNSDAHKKCALYLENELKKLGWETLVQKGEVKAYNGKKLSIKNIMGRYDINNPNRILLFAHWDSRPYADRGNTQKAKPIDGANDGASGVAVLLEIARQMAGHDKQPRIGVDVLFFDAEDYGQPQEAMQSYQNNTWCLGSQYWAQNIPIKAYRPKYGILLDMVGGANAVFPKEGHSLYFAPQVVEKVWNTAKKLGYDNYFVQNREHRGITDDHLYVNSMAKIPSIDIIHYRTDVGDFGTFHHTHDDNMSIIDKNTLAAVGNTVLHVIYSE